MSKMDTRQINIPEERIIVKMIFGAHLYGTATSESDMDYKGVFLPSKEELFLAKIPKSIHYSTGKDESKNTKNDVDIEFYSLHHFIKLACQGQTVAFDMLHAPKEFLLKQSPVWDQIIKNRSLFYSKNLNSFIDYARRQAGKYGIKGSRINAVCDVLNLLKTHDSQKKMREIWETLPRNDHCAYFLNSPSGLRQYQVCGKIFQESVTLGYVITVLSNFYDEYGKRAKLAADNRNIDWKAVSHAIRASYQTKEILTNKTIHFPLQNADFLKQVKTGSLDYITEVAPVLESLMIEVEELIKNSFLPETAAIKYWENFICKTLEESYLNS